MSEPIIRPAFLTFLCLLTFMSSISGLWSQSESLWNPGITAENNLKRYEEAHADIDRKANVAEKKIMNDFFGSLKQQTTPDAIVIGSIIMLIFETFSIYAAYLMWNLQKKDITCIWVE